MLLITIFLSCTSSSKDTSEKLAPSIATPDGAAPGFVTPNGGPVFIPIEKVKEEYDKGAAFYFLDARPTPDYDLRHITGAFSVPFYEKEDHLNKFPYGVWYIAYCACPHSESGIVADYFWENGHDKVGIIDEGYLEWEDRGYPTEGNEPLEPADTGDVEE